MSLRFWKRQPLLVLICSLAIVQSLLRLIVLRSIGALGWTGLAIHPLVLLAAATIVLVPIWKWHHRIGRSRAVALPVATALGAAHGASLIIDIAQIGYFQFTGGVLPLADLVTDPRLAALAIRYVNLPPSQIVAVIVAIEVLFVALYWAACVRLLSREDVGTRGRSVRPRSALLWLAPAAAAAFLALVSSSPFLVFRDPYLHLAISVDRMIPDTLTMADRRGSKAPREATPALGGRPRPLILIVIDTLRADAVDRNMPTLRSLVASGWLREIRHAYSTCTYSMCGILSILTGRSWDDFGAAPAVLPDMLKPYGYRSHFILSGNHRDFYKLGSMYGRSVASIQDDANSPGRSNDDDNLPIRLRRLALADPSRTFIYLHLMSEHQGAYLKGRPAGSWYETMMDLVDAQAAQDRYVARYEAGARNADRVVKQLLIDLKRMHMLDDAVVIITADHAERLGPGRLLGHGGDPDEAAMAVPLLVHDSRNSNLDERGIASTIDVVPTLLHGIGAAVPPGLAGRPLSERQGRDRVPVGTDRKTGFVVQGGLGTRFELQDR